MPRDRDGVRPAQGVRRAANQVLTRDQLLTLTRNREWEPFDRSIDIRIARVRRKIEADPGASAGDPHRARRGLHVRARPRRRVTGAFLRNREVTVRTAGPDRR